MITKICGLSDPGSISLIAALKPSMMGFIFYAPSPRNACALLPSIVHAIPHEIKRAGVFVDAPVAHVLHTADRYELDVLQLHGRETPETCRELKDNGYCVMKAIGVNSDIDWESIRPYEGTIDLYVFDTLTANHGGSGRKYDWNLLRSYPLNTPFLLSGGIGAEDSDAVRRAAETLPKMAGVDINSRFETAPGHKDADLVRQFLNAIRQ